MFSLTVSLSLSLSLYLCLFLPLISSLSCYRSSSWVQSREWLSARRRNVRKWRVVGLLLLRWNPNSSGTRSSTKCFACCCNECIIYSSHIAKSKMQMHGELRQYIKDACAYCRKHGLVKNLSLHLFWLILNALKGRSETMVPTHRLNPHIPGMTNIAPKWANSLSNIPIKNRTRKRPPRLKSARVTTRHTCAAQIFSHSVKPCQKSEVFKHVHAAIYMYNFAVFHPQGPLGSRARAEKWNFPINGWPRVRQRVRKRVRPRIPMKETFD